MLTSAEVRERLGISRDKLRLLIASGELEAMKISNAPNSHYRISEEALADYMERHSSPARVMS